MAFDNFSSNIAITIIIIIIIIFFNILVCSGTFYGPHWWRFILCEKLILGKTASYQKIEHLGTCFFVHLKIIEVI